MKRRHTRRTSAGTWAALILTVAVLSVGTAVLLRLRSGSDESVSLQAVQEVLNLNLPAAQQGGHADAGAPVQPAVTLPPETAQVETRSGPNRTAFTLTIGGTVTVGTKLRQAYYYSDSRKYDFTEVLSQLAPQMQADLCAVGWDNLVYADRKLSDNNTTAEALRMLTSAGVDLALLGYPKVYDFGEAGLAATVEAMNGLGLAEAGCTPMGTEPVRLMNVNGAAVAFLHYTQSLTSSGNTAAKKSGTGGLPKADADRIREDVAAARSAGANMTVVTVHWNALKSTEPTKDQRRMAAQIAEAGADLIVGMGDTPVQAAEWLESAGGRKTLCFYSVGSLMTAGRSNKDVAGALIQVRASVTDGVLNLEDVAVTPTYIWTFEQDKTTHFIALASNQPEPDGLDSRQRTAMGNALDRVRKIMTNSGIPLR